MKIVKQSRAGPMELDVARPGQLSGLLVMTALPAFHSTPGSLLLGRHTVPVGTHHPVRNLSGPRVSSRYLQGIPRPSRLILIVLAALALTLLGPSVHAAGSNLPCGATGFNTISCYQYYAGFVPSGSCISDVSSWGFPNGKNSSIEALYAHSSVSDTCSGNGNYGTMGIYGATVCDPGSAVLSGSCNDETRFEFLLKDQSLFMYGPGTVTVSGDFYLYGFLQDSGFISGCSIFSCSAGTVSTNDASLTVWTKLIDAFGKPLYTWPEQSFQPTPCTGSGGFLNWNCVNITKLNGDYSFSHSVPVPHSGAYQLVLDVVGDAHSVANGYSAAQTWVCLSTSNSVCYTPPNPTYPGSTNCPAGVPQNPCYYAQWKYTQYTLSTPPTITNSYYSAYASSTYLTLPIEQGGANCLQFGQTGVQLDCPIITLQSNGPADNVTLSASVSSSAYVTVGLPNVVSVPASGSATLELTVGTEGWWYCYSPGNCQWINSSVQGTWPITVTVSDSHGNSQSFTVTLVVYAPGGGGGCRCYQM